jgi:hypothetical protein
VRKIRAGQLDGLVGAPDLHAAGQALTMLATDERWFALRPSAEGADDVLRFTQRFTQCAQQFAQFTQ